MQRISTTVIGLVGESARTCPEALGQAANMGKQAPNRVVPVDTTVDKVQSAVATLASGRWWPELDRLLAEVDRTVPDRL